MYRVVKLSAAALAMTAILAGVGYAATRPIPENQPQVILQNTTESQLPGDMVALKEALQAAGPIQYKVLVIDSTDEEDKTDYLDRVAAKWGLPPADTLYLIIYTKDNYDIRFYMGANFRASQVSVEEMLGLVRTHYFAKSQQGDVAGGLADLIVAVNHRMTDPTKVSYAVPNPFGGDRQTAAQQIQLAQAFMSQYLDGLKSESVPERERLLGYRWADSQIHVMEGSAERIVYAIRFDVQPMAAAASLWVADSAQVDAEGWITGLSRTMIVVREGDLWLLEAVNTEP